MNNAIGSSNNIIEFPLEISRNIRNIPQLNKEQVDEHVLYLKNYVVDEVLTVIVQSVYNQLAISGHEINEYTMKDGALIVEAIRSIIQKNHGISHEFQNLAEEMFTKDENNSLTLSADLSIITNSAMKAVGNN